MAQPTTRRLQASTTTARYRNPDPVAPIEAMATVPSVCEHLHLPLQFLERPAAVDVVKALVGRLRDEVHPEPLGRDGPLVGNVDQHLAQGITRRAFTAALIASASTMANLIPPSIMAVKARCCRSCTTSRPSSAALTRTPRLTGL